MDTATIPLDVAGTLDKGATREEEVKPLGIAKTFDSFDATLRLAAMTEPDRGVRGVHHRHAEDARLQGQDRGGEPAGARRQPAPAAAAPPAPADSSDPFVVPLAEPAPAPEAKAQAEVPAALRLPPPAAKEAASATSNMVALAAIVVLAIIAVGLLVALLVK